MSVQEPLFGMVTQQKDSFLLYRYTETLAKIITDAIKKKQKQKNRQKMERTKRDGLVIHYITRHVLIEVFKVIYKVLYHHASQKSPIGAMHLN